MTKTAKSRLTRGETYTRDLDGGISLQGEVSPCVFMYPGYPLQISLILDAGDSRATAHATNRGLTATTAGEKDVRRLLARVRIKPCRRCSTPTFDPATVETNRAGLCDGCFLGDLKAKIAKETESQSLRLADRDRQMKASGHKFRLTAWIHPEAGDDYQADWYFTDRPAKARIRAFLREEGSSVLDDFQVIAL